MTEKKIQKEKEEETNAKRNEEMVLFALWIESDFHSIFATAHKI